MVRRFRVNNLQLIVSGSIVLWSKFSLAMAMSLDFLFILDPMITISFALRQKCGSSKRISLSIVAEKGKAFALFLFEIKLVLTLDISQEIRGLSWYFILLIQGWKQQVVKIPQIHRFFFVFQTLNRESVHDSNKLADQEQGHHSIPVYKYQWSSTVIFFNTDMGISSRPETFHLLSSCSGVLLVHDLASALRGTQ